MKRYVKSTAVDAKSALSQFDPIRKLLGEKEWYTIEEYLLNGDKKYSLKDILYDEEAWDAYADWKMKKYHEKPSIAASTRIKARRYLTASTEIVASIDSDINRYKKSLAQKAAKSGIYENFGAAEIRKLRDKYSVYQDDTTDYRTAEHNRRSIDSFEDWCMNYVGASTCIKADSEYTSSNPLKVDCPRGPYYVWEEFGKFKGSVNNPDAFISDARKVNTFDGFNSIDEVIAYVKKYF